MGYGGNVLDQGDLKSGTLKGPQGRLTTRPRAVYMDLDGLHALLHRLLCGVLCGHLCRKRRALTRALELHRPGTGPTYGISTHIRDRDQRIVERRLDMGDPVRYVLLDFLLLGPFFVLSFNPTSFRWCYFLFFFPMTALRGPLRVLELVCVL